MLTGVAKSKLMIRNGLRVFCNFAERLLIISVIFWQVTVLKRVKRKKEAKNQPKKQKRKKQKQGEKKKDVLNEVWQCEWLVMSVNNNQLKCIFFLSFKRLNIAQAFASPNYSRVGLTFTLSLWSALASSKSFKSCSSYHTEFFHVFSALSFWWSLSSVILFHCRFPPKFNLHECLVPFKNSERPIGIT